MSKERKIRQYSRTDLREALKALNRGEMNVYQAAKRYSVPRSTLSRYHADPSCNSRIGPQLIFTVAEEKLMVDWAQDVHRHGIVLRRTDLLEAANCILRNLPRKTKLNNNMVSNSWCLVFEKRHPEIVSYLQIEPITSEKSRGIPTLQCYETLFPYLNTLGLFDDSTRAFKYSELRFGLASNILKHFEDDEIVKEPDLITTAIITSAEGRLAFPMIVYPGDGIVSHEVANSLPLFCGFGHSADGMMTKETFHKFVTKVFYKFLVLRRTKFPVTLFIDGTKPNISLDLWQACQKLEIHLVAYNPDESLNRAKYTGQKTAVTRHIMDKLGDALLRRKQNNSNKPLKTEHFGELLQYALLNGLSKELILEEWSEFQFYQWIQKRKIAVEEIEFVSADVKTDGGDSGVTVR